MDRLPRRCIGGNVKLRGACPGRIDIDFAGIASHAVLPPPHDISVSVWIGHLPVDPNRLTGMRANIEWPVDPDLRGSRKSRSGSERIVRWRERPLLGQGENDEASEVPFPGRDRRKEIAQADETCVQESRMRV